MAVNDAERAEVKEAFALAVDLDEPEAMIDGLRRMCERKVRDRFIGEAERLRWRKTGAALSEALKTLAPGNLPEPDKADYGAQSAQPEGAEHGRAAEARPEAGTPPAA